MVLTFKKANCKNCYKCLRGCPVKSIGVINHQAQIIADKCILCGNCTRICPQNAKTVENNIADARALVAGSRYVVAALAPSYVGAFPEGTAEQIFNAFYALGFDEVQETAIGAKYVSREYNRILTEKKPVNLITSACPSVVRLIRQYYPDALPYLAPVDSPMIAHAKLIKEAHPDAAIVFVGPCIAKKQEAEDSGLIDTVLTFEEILDWLAAKEIDIASQPKTIARGDGMCVNSSLNYPVNRGIIKSMGTYVAPYDYLCVDGVEKCKEVLAAIGDLKGLFIEMSACENACVNGPCMPASPGGFIKATEIVRHYAKSKLDKNDACAPTKVTLDTQYARIPNTLKIPTEAQLREILSQVGKHTVEDRLDCGACGYPTCVDNAIAVFNGTAEPGMCVPFMRERAERITAKIIDNTPNGIIAVDENMQIVEINNRAKELLGLPPLVERGAQLSDYLNPTEYLIALSSHAPAGATRLYIDKTDKYVDLLLSHIPQSKLVFGIYTDVTTQSRQHEELKRAREETVTVANDVIEKQMRIVQEIASLLGETTADTQVALNKLKNVIHAEDTDE